MACSELLPLRHPATWLVAVFAASGVSCGGNTASGPPASDAGRDARSGFDAGRDARSADARSGFDAGRALVDAPLGTLTACPVSKIQTPGACYVVFPTEAGASAAGVNADSPSVALAPDPKVAPRHQLVLYLNGSGGHPSGIASPSVNFYDTAASLGYAALGVSYRSDGGVAGLCTPPGAQSPVDSCYFPTRKTLIVGTYQTGASNHVSDIRVDESIAGRTLLTLRYLAALDPGGGWNAYFTPGDPGVAPETQIVWSKIVVAGFSQGGGHAAAIGKMFPVPRVIQFSSTCDATLPDGQPMSAAVPATWTTGATPPWASDPSAFWGLGVKTVFTAGSATGGDTVCFTHLAVWKNLGMVASHQDDQAATCVKNGKTIDGHGAPIFCPQNAGAWQTMLQ